MIDNQSNLAAQWELLADRGCELLCPEEFYIECPGKSLHTTPNIASDCKVFINKKGCHEVICLYCFHRSCSEIIAETNNALYQIAIGENSHPLPAGAGGIIPRMHATRTKPDVPCPRLLDMVLTNYPWSCEDIANDPLGRVLEHPKYHFVHSLSLFDVKDYVWIGRDVYDSGSPGHKWRFRTPDDWIANPARLGPYVCPNPFRAGSISRCEDAVLKRRFLVVESDILTHDETGAIFRALNERVCRLRAVVDTAGKSLHGWFDYPAIGEASDHRDLLVSLRCDSSMLNPSQPCRLPGMLRDGRYQRLLYFDADSDPVAHAPSNPRNSPQQPIQ